MRLTNLEIAEKLFQYADLIEASGSNPYRVRAYRRAARVISSLNQEISKLIAENVDITTIPSIGKGIAFTINEIITTNQLPKIDKKIKNKDVNNLVEITGLGKKRIAILKNEYNIHNKEDLYKAIQSKQLNNLKWFTTLSTQILKELQTPKKTKHFLRLYHAIPIVNLLLSKLKDLKEVEQVEVVGAFRRKQEIVEQLDFVIQTSKAEMLAKNFIAFAEVRDVVIKNTQVVSVILWAGVKANLIFVSASNWATSLLFTTGSDLHLQVLSQIADEHNYNLAASGLSKQNKQVKVGNESDIYHYLNMSFIVPELREGRGEIEAALVNKLPKLVEFNDIKGDLHCHTNETDGTETLETMVEAASKKGYEYIAITDHSKRLVITNGMDEKRLLKQIEKIDSINSKAKKILILKSIEVDILEDGSLDLSNDVLKELDIVVCSVHSKFKLPEDKQTERIIRAMDNPYFNILGHATGRLIRSRPPYQLNIERILQTAKEKHCFIELNSQPYRLDVNDIYAKMAKEMGVKLAISSDAHSVRELNFMQLGIYQGRRGWLEPDDVINTRSWTDLKKILSKK